jgi:mycoredoxin
METDGRQIDAVVFFWRPGCGFCVMLRRKLEKLGVRMHEVNIWDDPRGAQAVRTITGGSETVPTVVVGDRSMVNPSAGSVLEAIEDVAPHLLGARGPDDGGR